MQPTLPLKRLLVKQSDIVGMLNSRKRAHSASLFGPLACVLVGDTRRYPLSYIEGVIGDIRGPLNGGTVKRFNQANGKALFDRAQLEWQQRVKLYTTSSELSPQGYLSAREACIVLGMSEGVVTKYLGKQRFTPQIHDGMTYLLTQEVVALCQWPE